jgi:RES domain-containing protein
LTTAYRLCSKRHPANSGKGAAITGGRWNPIGTEVIYASSSAALSLTEVVVHFAAGLLPDDYVLTEIHIPETVRIERVPDDKLPANWDALTDNPEPQEFGGRWARELRTCVLSVPSCIVPTERNFVINPAHPDFAAILFLPSQPFTFDPRLKKPG